METGVAGSYKIIPISAVKAIHAYDMDSILLSLRIDTVNHFVKENKGKQNVPL